MEWSPKKSFQGHHINSIIHCEQKKLDFEYLRPPIEESTYCRDV